MKIMSSLLAGAILLIATLTSFSQENNSPKKTACCTYISPSLPPVGIMGDHHHHKGGWMASYRYKSISMEGMQNGSEEIGIANVLQEYMMSPTTMRMQGHMVGLMYGVSRRVTLMAMLPYMRMDMDMKSSMGMTSTMSSAGVGDLKLSSIVEIWRQRSSILLGNLGVSLPIGSISAKGDMPMGENLLLPYSMQMGSGSFGVLTSLTFSHAVNRVTLGLQYNGNIRLNDNNKDYRMGDLHDINIWTAYKANQWISTSVRLKAAKSGKIDGMATELNKVMTPLNDQVNSGSTRIRGLVGINVYPQLHQLENHVVGLEFGIPLYQEFTGTQMKSAHTLTLGWQYAF
jgi:hypothetical protein